MKITVRNRKTYKDQGEWICRGKSVLGNPFHLVDVNDDVERDKIIKEYKVWLWTHIQNNNPIIMKELERLHKLARDTDELNLICFCAPKPCHGDVVKTCIEWIERENNAHRNYSN